MKSGCSLSTCTGATSGLLRWTSSRKSTSFFFSGRPPPLRRWNQTTCSTTSSPGSASSTMPCSSTVLPRRKPMSPAMTTFAPASTMRSLSAPTPSPA